MEYSVLFCRMKWLALFTFCMKFVEGDIVMSASDDDGLITTCIAVGTSIQITCTIVDDPSYSGIFWYKDNTFLAQCSTSNDVCLLGDGSENYTFTGNASQKMYYMNIRSFKEADEASYICALGSNTSINRIFNATLCVRVTSVSLIKDNSNIPGGKLEVDNGKPSILSCEITPKNSMPAPIIQWFLGSSLKANSTQTDFKLIAEDGDHGEVFYCEAYNTKPTEKVTSDKPNLYVKVEARTPVLLNGTNSSITVLEGDSYFLHCRTTPTRPAAFVTWKVGGTDLLHANNSVVRVDGTLEHVISSVIYNGSRYDNGTNITCESRIQGQSNWMSSSKIITVWWRPSNPYITPMNRSFPWLEGKIETLNCTSSDLGNPPSSVYWSMSIGNTSLPGKLVIGPLTSQHDEKEVTCELHNKFTSAKKEVIKATTTLQVQYKPWMTSTIPKILKVDEGKDIEITCSATGNPQPNITWLGMSSPLPGPTLKLTDVDRSEARVYTCRAKAVSSVYYDFLFLTEQNVTLIVQYPPNVSLNVSGSMTENEKLTLTCLADGIPNKYNFHNWTRVWAGIIITSSHLMNSVHRNSIPSLQLQDSGNYSCSVDNTVRDRNDVLYQYGTTEILVKVSPKFFKHESLFAGKLGENITMSIPFYSYPHYLSVSVKLNYSTENLNFSKYMTVIDETAIGTAFYDESVVLNGHHCNFTIVGLEETDFTTYQVLISNEVGSQQTSFTVKSQSVPMDPSDFLLVSVKGNTACFSWVKGFNGGETQTFLIQLSDEGEDSWYNGTIIDEFDEYSSLGNKSYRANITDLKPGSYSVQLLAVNSFGQTSPLLLSSKIIISPTVMTKEASFPLSAAVGCGLGFGIMLILTAILIVIWKRKSASKKDDSKQSILLLKRHSKSEQNDNKTEININPMYESAGEIPLSPTPTSDVYAQVNKQPNHSTQVSPGDVYSKVQKPEVKISSKMEKKIKKQKEQRQHKTGEQTKLDEGLVYENSEILNSGSKASEDVYENPACGIGDEKITRPTWTRNEDGLIYIDVEIPKQTNANKKKPVIHGEEDCTVYADIAYGKIGEHPLDNKKEIPH